MQLVLAKAARDRQKVAAGRDVVVVRGAKNGAGAGRISNAERHQIIDVEADGPKKRRDERGRVERRGRAEWPGGSDIGELLLGDLVRVVRHVLPDVESVGASFDDPGAPALWRADFGNESFFAGVIGRLQLQPAIFAQYAQRCGHEATILDALHHVPIVLGVEEAAFIFKNDLQVIEAEQA